MKAKAKPGSDDASVHLLQGLLELVFGLAVLSNSCGLGLCSRKNGDANTDDKHPLDAVKMQAIKGELLQLYIEILRNYFSNQISK